MPSWALCAAAAAWCPTGGHPGAPSRQDPCQDAALAAAGLSRVDGDFRVSRRRYRYRRSGRSSATLVERDSISQSPSGASSAPCTHCFQKLVLSVQFRCLLEAPVLFPTMSSAVHNDACRVRSSVLSANRKPLSPIRKKSRARTSQQCPVLLVNQTNTEDSYSTVDATKLVELEVCIELSNLVDRARESVCDHLDTCASWRRKAMNVVIQLVHAYGINDETAAYAIALLDRFLSAKIELKSEDPNLVSVQTRSIWDKADCYAIACYLIATKFKDMCAPCIGDMMRIIRPAWPKELISECEEEVLCSIGWVLNVTTGATSRLSLQSARIQTSAIVPHLASANTVSCTMTAFEIASELLRHANLPDGSRPPPLREHVDFLVLLAHFRPDMLRHSCHDIATAAIHTALRAQGAAIDQLAAESSASALECAARMAFISSSEPGMMPAADASP